MPADPQPPTSVRGPPAQKPRGGSPWSQYSTLGSGGKLRGTTLKQRLTEINEARSLQELSRSIKIYGKKENRGFPTVLIKIGQNAYSPSRLTRAGSGFLEGSGAALYIAVR